MTEKTDSTKHDDDKDNWHLYVKERLSNIDKNQSEIDRNSAEIRKTNSVIDKYHSDIDKNKIETALTSKKVFWYEVSLIFILVGIGIAIGKLFLK